MSEYSLFGQNGVLADVEDAFLALKADLLDRAIVTNGDRLMKGKGIRTPSHCVSTMLLIARVGPISITDIAAAFGESHQLVQKRIEQLYRLGLVKKSQAKGDGRIRLIQLSTAGKKEIPVLIDICKSVGKAFRQIQKKLDIDLAKAIDLFVQELPQHSIYGNRTNAKKG